MKTSENHKTVTLGKVQIIAFKQKQIEQKINLLVVELDSFPKNPFYMSDDEFMDFDILVTDLFEQMISLRTLRSM